MGSADVTSYSLKLIADSCFHGGISKQFNDCSSLTGGNLWVLVKKDGLKSIKS